jgi:hypothetical protein
MIQRIQTLFLIIALGAIAACFFIPFWIYNGPEGTYTYEVNLFAVKCTGGEAQSFFISTIPIIVILSVSAIICIVDIFYYKNRHMQIKINNFNIFLTVIFIGTVYLWIPSMITDKIPLAKSSWQYGLILPLITFISLILANRFIKKDENLVKSADRLR